MSCPRDSPPTHPGCTGTEGVGGFGNDPAAQGGREPAGTERASPERLRPDGSGSTNCGLGRSTCIKAQGIGPSLPLESFPFLLDNASEIQIHSPTHLPMHPALWNLSLRPTAGDRARRPQEG